MSENLIYGTDILSYGAVADGKTDCSVALSKALENGESLISFPFGTYLFTKSITLSSNTKLHFHANANIIFAPENDNADSFIYAKDASSLEICGGLFGIKDGTKCNAFCFKNCQNIRISNCSVNAPTGIGSIVFDSCEYASVVNVTFNGMSDALVLTGKCLKVTFKNCTVKSAVNVIQCAKQNRLCDIDGLDIRNVSVSFCDSFIEFLCGKAENVNIENVNARLSFSFFKLFSDFALSDATLENIKLYIIDRVSKDGKASAYFSLASTPENLEIRNLKRLNELESVPPAPTLLFKNTNADKAKLIIDGISLDNVINARGKSKTVSMTTAKLTNPTGKFIYTLEISVAKDDSLNIPYGDFDYLTLYCN
ncbi:MAG: hypothetical protein IJW06_05000 [Clostridia bacterium]|nr:hypothetical protein [Clostridia bacterium]